MNIFYVERTRDNYKELNNLGNEILKRRDLINDEFYLKFNLEFNNISVHTYLCNKYPLVSLKKAKELILNYKTKKNEVQRTSLPDSGTKRSSEIRPHSSFGKITSPERLVGNPIGNFRKKKLIAESPLSKSVLTGYSSTT